MPATRPPSPETSADHDATEKPSRTGLPYGIFELAFGDANGIKSSDRGNLAYRFINTWVQLLDEQSRAGRVLSPQGSRAATSPSSSCSSGSSMPSRDERRLETELWRGVRHRHCESRREQLPPSAYRYRASRRLCKL